MKNFLLAVVLAFSSAVVLSGEVGAQNPQIASSAKLEVAIAETGTSTSWALQPLKSTANAHQLAEHLNRTSAFEAVMNSRLEALLEQKLSSSLRY